MPRSLLVGRSRRRDLQTDNRPGHAAVDEADLTGDAAARHFIDYWMGAGAWQRAVRATWIGGLVSFGALGLIGWTVALMPENWARLFASDPAVVAASVAYITHVAPFYCLFGLALTLYFASQGAGRMVVPAVAGVMRMIATILAGWLAVEKFGFGLEGVFASIAVGMAVYGGLMGGLLLVMPWRARHPVP